MQAIGAAVALATTATAFQQMENPFMTPQEMSVIDSLGTSPCVFKLGDNFYDYTPLKLTFPEPYAPYIDGNFIPRSLDIKYYFVFGWCQHLEDVPVDTSGDVE